MRSLARVIALSAAIFAAGCSGTSRRAPEPPPSTPGLRLSYDERGRLTDSSRPVLQTLLRDAGRATDIFILSHGWWNDASTAECMYAAMIDGIVTRKPSGLDPAIRPVLVGIYWPSAVFPVEHAGCGASARLDADATPESTRLAVSAAPIDIDAWARAAFPAAIAGAGYARERDRLAELLNRERGGERLTEREGEEVLSILLGWRTASGSSDAQEEAPGEQSLDATARSLAERWSPPAPSSDEDVPERAGFARWINAANVFTFWSMKERAGTVGSRGVYDLLASLQPARGRGVRLHLIAHSFGSKLLSAALTGHGRQPNVVDSFLMLQGALSHFAFSTASELAALEVRTSRPGLYADIVARGLVRGPFVATYSTHDVANRFWYPKGVRVSGDDFERARPPDRWGSVGYDGIQGPATQTVAWLPARSPRVFTAGSQTVNMDASEVIGGHSDVLKEAVYDLIWSVVLTARRPSG